MPQTGLLFFLVSIKLHSILPLPHSSFSHTSPSIHWEILLVPHLKYIQNLTSALLYCPHSDLRTMISHGDYWASRLFSLPASTLDPPPLPHSALSTEARAIMLNVKSLLVSRSFLNTAAPPASSGHWRGPLLPSGWFSSRSTVPTRCTQVSGALTPIHRGAKGYFSQFYWDVIGIHHCISIRWTAEIQREIQRHLLDTPQTTNLRFLVLALDCATLLSMYDMPVVGKKSIILEVNKQALSENELKTRNEIVLF